MHFRFHTEQERNEHCITHWATIPYSCGVCGKSAFSLEIAEKHFLQSHANFQMNIITSGPTISKELKIADELHIKEVLKEFGRNVTLRTEGVAKSAVTEVNIGDILEPSTPTVTDNLEENALATKLAGSVRHQNEGKEEVLLDVCNVDEPTKNIEYEVHIFFYFNLFL